MNGLAARLRARAKGLGLADAEVARRAGLSQARYAHYSSGKREPDYQTLARICRVLGTNPSALLGFEEQPAQLGEIGQLRDRLSLTASALPVSKLRIAVALLDALTGLPED